MASLRQLARIVSILAVAAVSFLAYHQLAGMDRIFFARSWPGLKGLGWYTVGHYERAAREYRAHWAARIAGGRTTGDRGTDLILTGDLDAAEHLAQAALGRNPRNVPATLLLAEVALERGMAAEARGLAARAVATAPDDPHALVVLSLASARTGDAGAAIDAVNRDLRTGTLGGRLVTFYQVLETTGTLGARPVAERPLCLLAHYHRYFRIFDLSHARVAARYARQAIAAGDRVADAHLSLGILSQKAGRLSEALASFQEALRHDPGYADAYRWAAVVYGEQGDLANEYRMMAGAVTSSRDCFYCDLFFDVAVNKVGDPGGAAKVLEPAAARAPQDARVRERLGYISTLLGDERRAVAYYQEAVALEPRNAFLYNGLGWALNRLGRPDEAIATLRRAVELAPALSEPHSQLAWIHYSNQRYREAIPETEIALRLGRPDAHLQGLLCILYHDEVDLDRARACVLRLRALDPGNSLARVLLPKIEHEARLR